MAEKFIDVAHDSEPQQQTPRKIGHTVTDITNANPGIVTIAAGHDLVAGDLFMMRDSVFNPLDAFLCSVKAPVTATTFALADSSGVNIDTGAMGAWAGTGNLQLFMGTGTGNQITNDVRVLYDDTNGLDRIADALQRAKEVIAHRQSIGG